MNDRREETALGTARARFIGGLGRKASELKGAVALLAATPDAARPREEMRRRLHALYASAQVFRIAPLAEALKEAIDRLDMARDRRRALGPDDLDSLGHLAATLPGLAAQSLAAETPGGTERLASIEGPVTTEPSGRGDASTEDGPAPPRVPSRRPPQSVRERRSTLTGIMAQRRPTSDAVLEAMSTPSAAPPLDPGTPDHGTPDHGTMDIFEAATTPGSVSAMIDEPTHGASVGSVGDDVLDTVISVLVLDTAEWQSKVRDALDGDKFEILGASDPERALQLARTSAPDVVIADAGIVDRAEDDFIARLRSDPLTGFVPVILLLPDGMANDVVAVRQEGVDATVGKPFDAGDLGRVVRRVSSALYGARGLRGDLGALTAKELAARLAEEIVRGIADAAEGQREVRVPIGDGAEILAAAWSAIARVRQQVTERSGGKVRFRDAPERGRPAMMALAPEGADATEPGMTEPGMTEPGMTEPGTDLTGRRIVVADDDPAVVWFFAGVLREAGADVFEAEDGLAAFEEARRRHPDVVISDILMPGLDGFALSRAMGRDPALADVPVILISWKEDFLERMRDLQAGAKGFLRKEAGSAQILAQVREVLRPRALFDARLRAGGEIRGRIEGVGMVTLLRETARVRGDARVTARDAWSLYEVDLREGRLVDLTVTATDGSFARGERALPALLGILGGRYTISDSRTTIRGTFTGPLEETLGRGIEQLGAVLDAVSGVGLPLAAKLELDEDVLASFLKTSPEPVRRTIGRVAAGEGPRALLTADAVDHGLLESALVDLGRRGGIRGVEGPAGEDRIAACLADRRANRDIQPSAPPEPPEAAEGPRFTSPFDAVTPRVGEPSPAETTADILDEARRLAAGLAPSDRPPPASSRPLETVRPRRDSGPVADLDAPFAEAHDSLPPAAPAASSGALAKRSVADEADGAPTERAGPTDAFSEQARAVEPPPRDVPVTDVPATDAPATDRASEDAPVADAAAETSVDSLDDASSATASDPALHEATEAFPEPFELRRPRVSTASPASEPPGSRDEPESRDETEDTHIAIRAGDPDLLLESEPPPSGASTPEGDAVSEDADTLERPLHEVLGGDASLVSLAELSPIPTPAPDPVGDVAASDENDQEATMIAIEPSRDAIVEEPSSSEPPPEASPKRPPEPPREEPSRARPVAAPVAPPAKPAVAAPPGSEGLGWFGRLFTLVVLGVIGFAGGTFLFGTPDEDPSGEETDNDGSAGAVDDRDDPAPTDLPDEGEPELDFGQQTFPEVTADDIAVPEDHGLLVMEAPEGIVVDEARIDGAPVEWPIRRPLREGRHEIELRRGSENVYLWVVVRRGHTHVLPVP